MNCTRCETYIKSRGRGGKNCLSCKQYKAAQQQGNKRQTINYQDIPQTMLENIAEEFNNKEILSALQRLPEVNSAVISLIYTSGFTIEQAANMLKMPKRSVERIKKSSLEILRKHLIP